DPDRQALQVEGLAQLLERLDPAKPLLLGLVALRLEREPGVLLGKLLEAPLLSALGGPYLDARAAELGQELGQRRGVPGVPGDDDLRRNRRRRAVVLDHEGLEERGCVLSLDVLEVEPVPVDHLAAAERKDLHRRPVAVDRQADHVDVADAALLDRLALREAPDREEPVAVARRLLEALGLSRITHLLPELAPDRSFVA